MALSAYRLQQPFRNQLVRALLSPAPISISIGAGRAKRAIKSGQGNIVRIIKQVLRKQIGVVLLETKMVTGQPDRPARVSYAISSKRDPKIRCFDDLQIAQSYFDNETSFCRKTLHSQDRRYALMIEIGQNSYQEQRA